ncbi:sugar ABC transporter substrate-binding protein [Aureimonas frigidaquae]|uniref:sugar ABC transporter substrate-binding protein n=1 Tax=Aureimonas frigidaquae TaxID=424757 RepID=UPI000784065C|nr:substrate-binding domain-containing protein [Aureimonas frigidaquae]
MKNRIFGVVGACSFAALMVGAAGTAQALEIAMVHSNAAAQSDQRVKAGFEAWIAENGKSDWNVSYLDSGGSGETTAANIQDAASRGVDAIVMTMADLRASRAALDAAKAANIPVFAADSGYVDGVVVDVTTNNWAMSSDVSVYLLDQMGGQGNLIFYRMAEHHGTRKRGDVMQAVLKEYPDVKVLAEHNINYRAFFEDTSRTMEDFAARFGTEINAVWAPWDEPAQAVVNVLNASGLTDVKVIGIDGHPQAIAEVCKPESQMIATVSQPFEKMGGQIADWIQEIVVDGKPAAEVIPTKTVYMDAPLITKQNCQEYLK